MRAHAVRSSPIRDALGRIISHVVSLRDVTASRLVQREREQRHRYLNALWRALPDAVVVLDADGTVREWNAGAADLLGHTASSAAGVQLLSLILPDFESRRAIASWLARAPQGTTLSGLTIRIQLPSGRRTDLSLSGAPVIMGGRLLATVLVFSDISALLTIERRLRAANDELGSRVAARTADLSKANQRLEEEVAKLQKAEASLLLRNRELLSLQSAVAATGSSLEVEFILETVTWEMVDLLDIASLHRLRVVPGGGPDRSRGRFHRCDSLDKRSARAFGLDTCPILRRTLEERYARSFAISDCDTTWSSASPCPGGAVRRCCRWRSRDVPWAS